MEATAKLTFMAFASTVVLLLPFMVLLPPFGALSCSQKLPTVKATFSCLTCLEVRVRVRFRDVRVRVLWGQCTGEHGKEDERGGEKADRVIVRGLHTKRALW